MPRCAARPAKPCWPKNDEPGRRPARRQGTLLELLAELLHRLVERLGGFALPFLVLGLAQRFTAASASFTGSDSTRDGGAPVPPPNPPPIGGPPSIPPSPPPGTPPSPPPGIPIIPLPAPIIPPLGVPIIPPPGIPLIPRPSGRARRSRISLSCANLLQHDQQVEPQQVVFLAAPPARSGASPGGPPAPRRDHSPRVAEADHPQRRQHQHRTDPQT